MLMHRNKSVSNYSQTMVARPSVPRSSFNMERGLKTTFDAGLLIPVLCEEVLPGDTFKCRMTAFCRLATPIFPVMDNLHLESFFFFVPNRLTWQNWKRFMGEQTSPTDPINYVVPQIVSPGNGHAINSLYDYFGLPTVGQVGAGLTVSHSALPLRAYAQIYNEWFRDENLCVPMAPGIVGDGPDLYTLYGLQPRGKRKDYFTGSLPFPQKGAAVALPLTGNALVRTSPASAITGSQSPLLMNLAVGGGNPTPGRTYATGAANTMDVSSTVAVSTAVGVYPSNLYADLSTVTSTTINALRQAMQIQTLLERDARGGTRYVELIKSHFGVESQDSRLQRPEYLGGGHTPIIISPIAQTSASGVSGGTTPQANLSAVGTALASGHGFTQSFTEHGYVIGIVSVRADLTYQQGLRRHWSRATRYDYYWPAFANLGEQAVLNKEIFCKGDANDNLAFGYQERWAELRYSQNEITGLFRSTSAGTIDPWHLAQRFTVLPTLNETFIKEAPPLARVLAVGAAAGGQQLIGDFLFQINAVRPLPMYSTPGIGSYL